MASASSYRARLSANTPLSPKTQRTPKSVQRSSRYTKIQPPRFLRPPNLFSKITTALLFILLLIPPLLCLTKLGPTPTSPLTFYVLFINTLTIALYTHDKSRSRMAGSWRIKESHLHFSELAGGWPAAFVCQRLLTHKRKKLSYQVEFWMIVGLHELIWVDVATGGLLRQWAGRLVG